MNKFISSLSAILIIGGAVYFVKYVEHQKTVISALDSRVKTLEEKVFPPRTAPKPAEPRKKSSRKNSK